MASTTNVTLVIPSTSYVAAAPYACIKAFAGAGGSVVRVSNASAADPSLRYDERGYARSQTELAWLHATPLAPLQPAISLVHALEPLVLPKGHAQRPVHCVDNVTSSTAFGVLCRYTPCSAATGKPALDGTLLPATATALPASCAFTVFLINYRTTAATLLLLLREAGPVATGFFLLTNSTISISDGLVLDAMEQAVVII
jgi:hypothetical protein